MLEVGFEPKYTTYLLPLTMLSLIFPHSTSNTLNITSFCLSKFSPKQNFDGTTSDDYSGDI